MLLEIEMVYSIFKNCGKAYMLPWHEGKVGCNGYKLIGLWCFGFFDIAIILHVGDKLGPYILFLSPILVIGLLWAIYKDSVQRRWLAVATSYRLPRLGEEEKGLLGISQLHQLGMYAIFCQMLNDKGASIPNESLELILDVEQGKAVEWQKIVYNPLVLFIAALTITERLASLFDIETDSSVVLVLITVFFAIYFFYLYAVGQWERRSKLVFFLKNYIAEYRRLIT